MISKFAQRIRKIIDAHDLAAKSAEWDKRRNPYTGQVRPSPLADDIQAPDRRWNRTSGADKAYPLDKIFRR